MVSTTGAAGMENEPVCLRGWRGREHREQGTRTAADFYALCQLECLDAIAMQEIYGGRSGEWVMRERGDE